MPKKPLRETRRENQSAHKFYGAMYGKPPMIDENLKPKREIVKRSDKYELEASVVADISRLLAHHPQVLFACRSNSGAAYMTGRDGKEMPVTFNRIIRSPVQMRISDFWGVCLASKEVIETPTIIGNKQIATMKVISQAFNVKYPNARMFAIECKRRNWTKPTDQREHEQAAFLQMVRDAGGVGIFATCAEDVLNAFNVEFSGTPAALSPEAPLERRVSRRATRADF